MKKRNPQLMALKIMTMLANAGIVYSNQREAIARFTLLIAAKLSQQGEAK